MNNRFIANFAAVLLIAAPVYAGGNSAISALIGSRGLPSAVIAVPPVSSPVRAGLAMEKGAQSWTGEVKKVYGQNLASGRLFTLPAVKNSELPAAALRQLNKDNYGQASRISTAYKLLVRNQPAFVIHNRRDGRSLAAHIYDAYGRLIALAGAAAGAPLYWADLSSSSGAGSEDSGSGNPGYPGYGGGPDDVDDGMGGQGPAGGGPDDTDWGGCGGSGSGGGSGPDDTGGGF